MDVPVPRFDRQAPRPVVVRSAMAGLFLLGGLISLLGAFLPVWMYHLHFDLATAGDYFLALALGLFSASLVSPGARDKLGARGLLLVSCILSGACLLILAPIPSPAGMIFPFIGLGFAAGLLTTGISWLLLSPLTPAIVPILASLGGLFFGGGALFVVLLFRIGVHTFTAPNILALAALLPATLALLHMHRAAPFEEAPAGYPLPANRSEVQYPLAGLLYLALSVQSGNEWMVGGWLCIYLIRRLGVSVETALSLLAVYWVALTLGKLLGPRLRWDSRAFRLPLAGTGTALFGCLLLLSTTGVGGALVGVICLGAGLGAVAPCILGCVWERFPHARPGLFHGLFSLSVIVGMLAPWSIGHLAHAWVIQSAIWAVVFGILLVFVLQSAILLEFRLAARAQHPRGGAAAAGR